MSNYLEHLDSGDAVIEQLRVAARLLRPGGQLIVLQPNIRLVGPALLGLHRPPGRPDRAQPRWRRPSSPAFGPWSSSRASCRTRRRGGCRRRLLWSAPISASGRRGGCSGRRRCTSERRRDGAWPTCPELSIVLPVYNEGEAVEPVLRALIRRGHDAHELVVVYDFDADTTVPVIERLSSRDRRDSAACGTISVAAC